MVAGAGGGRDLGGVGKGPDVVGRRRPGEIDLAQREARCRESRRHCRRLCVGPGLRGRVLHCRVAAQVAGRIGGPHPVPVRGRRRQPDVVERGAGRGRDLDEVRTSRTLTTLDPIPGHADVVGRRRPRQVHQARTGRCGGQPGRRAGGGRVGALRGGRNDARVAAQVGSRIGGPHPVPVRGRGRQTGVVEARPGRSPDLDEVRTTRTLTTLNPVPGHPHVVGRRRPRKVDLARGDRSRRKPRRHRRRLRIRPGLRGRTLHARVAAQVAGQIRRPHPIAVTRRRRQPRVVKRSASRSPDLDKVRTTRTLTTLNPIPGHPHVVRRRRPRKVDLRRRDRSRRKPRRHRRRHRIRRASTAHRRRHVRLDLARAQRPPVHTHLVDPAREVLPIERITADRQRPRRGRNRRQHRPTRHLHTTNKQPQRRPVIGRRQMRPHIQRQRRTPIDRARKRPPRRRRTRIRRALQEINVVRALIDHIPPAPTNSRKHPRLQRHRRRQIKRPRIRHRHPRTRTIKRQRIPKPARRDPTRRPNRTHIPIPRRIPSRRPHTLIKRPRSSKTAGGNGRVERCDVALVRGRDDDPVALGAPVRPRVERVRHSSAGLRRRSNAVLEAFDVVEHEWGLPADPVDFDSQTGGNRVEGQVDLVRKDCHRGRVGQPVRVRHCQDDLVARQALEVMAARGNLQGSGLRIRKWSARGMDVRVMPKEDRPGECARRQRTVVWIGCVPRVVDRLAGLEQMTVSRRKDRRVWRIPDPNSDAAGNGRVLTV